MRSYDQDWTRTMKTTTAYQTTTCLLLLVAFSSSVTSANTDFKEVVVRTKTTAVLPCTAPEGTDTEDLALEWTKPGMDHLYVFLYRDGRPYLVYQDTHFKDRVRLADHTLQNGDLSVVLTDASAEDRGRYECHIFSQSERRRRSVFDTQPITVVELKVLDPEPKVIHAFAGQDVVLPFDPAEGTVTELVWKRPDLHQDHFVFLYGLENPHHQLSQYQGRVSLKEETGGQNRDLSVVLKNVQPSDSGRYQCHIAQSRRRKRDTHQSEPHVVVDLRVASGCVQVKAVAAVMLLPLFLMFWG